MYFSLLNRIEQIKNALKKNDTHEFSEKEYLEDRIVS